MVEGARLESVYRGNSIEGSNPSLSAMSTTYNVPCDSPSATTIEVRVHPSAVIAKEYANGGCKTGGEDAKMSVGAQAGDQRSRGLTWLEK